MDKKGAAFKCGCREKVCEGCRQVADPPPPGRLFDRTFHAPNLPQRGRAASSLEADSCIGRVGCAPRQGGFVGCEACTEDNCDRSVMLTAVHREGRVLSKWQQWRSLVDKKHKVTIVLLNTMHAGMAAGADGAGAGGCCRCVCSCRRSGDSTFNRHAPRGWRYAKQLWFMFTARQDDFAEETPSFVRLSAAEPTKMETLCISKTITLSLHPVRQVGLGEQVRALVGSLLLAEAYPGTIALLCVR